METITSRIQRGAKGLVKVKPKKPLMARTSYHVFYILSRQFEGSDNSLVRKKLDYKESEYIHGIVSCRPFQHRTPLDAVHYVERMCEAMKKHLETKFGLVPSKTKPVIIQVPDSVVMHDLIIDRFEADNIRLVPVSSEVEYYERGEILSA